MNNYNEYAVNKTLTRNLITDKNTGEILKEYNEVPVRNIYQGPRRYYRIMERFIKAMVDVDGKIGVKIIDYILNNLDPITYTVFINKSWLAKNLGVTRKPIDRTIKILENNQYIIKHEKPSHYYVDPDMIFSNEISDNKWQELKQNYQYLKIKNKE